MPFLSFLALLYLSACAYLYFAQRSFLYVPTPETGAANAEVISLKSDGETLRIWHVGINGASAVIFFGGNAENVADLIPYFSNAFPKQAIYLVNYRGYGGSTGSPSEAGLFKDAATIFDYVRAKHTNVSLIGRSLGSGVAIYLATIRLTNKLVLVSPYDSIENLARKQFRIFPISLLLKDKFRSNVRAKITTTPTLVILSDHDEVVPRENSEALIAAFPASIAKVEVVPNTSHNTIELSDGYWKHLRDFLG